MAYRGIRIVGLMSSLMCVGCLALLLWVVFRSAPDSDAAMLRLVGQGFLVVFFFLTLLTSQTSTVVEKQADQIVLLERQLAELQSQRQASPSPPSGQSSLN